MADHVSPTKRSAIMALIKAKNTRPELIARKMLYQSGYRFRLHRKDLPGSPDIVFPSKKKAVFVHGCFWHAHSCRYGHLPKTRLEYWKPKLEANKVRDNLARKRLLQAGWKTYVLWQCQLKDPIKALQRIRRFLGRPNVSVLAGNIRRG